MTLTIQAKSNGTGGGRAAKPTAETTTIRTDNHIEVVTVTPSVAKMVRPTDVVDIDGLDLDDL